MNNLSLEIRNSLFLLNLNSDLNKCYLMIILVNIINNKTSNAHFIRMLLQFINLSKL